MTTEELLKAENAFIRLHNQGETVEKIAGNLGVAEEIVEGWEVKLLEAIKNFDGSDNIDVVIEGINEKGSYEYQYSLQLNMSGVEKLKFDLWRIARTESNDSKTLPVIQKAGELLSFVEKNLVDFNYEFTRPDGKEIKSTFNVHNYTQDSEDKIAELMHFYEKYILRRKNIHNNSILIVSETKDCFLEYADIVSYSVKTVKVAGFQGIQAAELHDLPIDASWILILGNNGYGKSTFLQSLVIGLFGNTDGERTLADNNQSKIGVEYKSKLKNIVNNLWTPSFQPLEHIACYGPSRLQIQARMSQNEVAEKSTTTYGLFNPDGVLLNIESKLIEWYLEKNERLHQVKTLFQEVIPHLADIIVRKNKQDDYEVLYVEKAGDGDNNTFDPVPFDKLAAGFRSIIGLIGDLLIRFIRKQPAVKQLSELAGIVLIDELENHLHPKWQYQLPTLLSKVFPDIQFIAATHSVIPILGAPKNSVFLKLNRTKETGITVERMDIDMTNLLPNSILTSPIFDMDTIKPIVNENAAKLRTEDTFDEIVANDEISRQLRELDRDPSKYPPLLQE